MAPQDVYGFFAVHYYVENFPATSLHQDRRRKMCLFMLMLLKQTSLIEQQQTNTTLGSSPAPKHSHLLIDRDDDTLLDELLQVRAGRACMLCS